MLEDIRESVFIIAIATLSSVLPGLVLLCKRCPQSLQDECRA